MNVLEAFNVRITGDGPTVVLSHGFGTDQSAWRHLVPWLAQTHRVISYDLACAGTVDYEVSSRKPYDTLDEYALDLLTILRVAGVEQCTFVGHSVSGMIGLLAAYRAPSVFSQLIMISSSPRYLNDVDYQGGFEWKDLGEVFDAIAENYRNWARTFAPMVAGVPPDDPAGQEFTGALLSIRPDIALRTVMTIFNSDLREQVRGFLHPTVIVQSRDDPAVPLSVAEWLKVNLPNSTLELINATGHLPHLTAPDEVRRVLRRYI